MIDEMRRILVNVDVAAVACVVPSSQPAPRKRFIEPPVLFNSTKSLKLEPKRRLASTMSFGDKNNIRRRPLQRRQLVRQAE